MTKVELTKDEAQIALDALTEFRYSPEADALAEKLEKFLAARRRRR